jgi:predicted MPP superfamily phosphohydrolase
MKPLRALTAAGAGLGAYALLEARRPRLTSKDVALAPGRPSLDVLHISDMHMTGSTGWLASWITKLPGMLSAAPDVVACTGDMIEDDDGIEPALESLGALEARVGRFYVLGSHDYYVARFKPYTSYLSKTKGPTTTNRADTARLQRGLDDAGWIALVNTTHVIATDAGRVRVSGVDDPYLRRHRTDHIVRARDDVLAIALVHAPDVVSEWILAGFDVVLAGHTHAGQVRVPGLGALVTNSSLPSALAGGLSRVGNGWLHVSPGLGAGKFAPIRLNCPPEATLLRLRPRAA